jgi:hypothetical protein
MNHVQPILSIVFSTNFKVLKVEFYLSVMVAAGQAKYHGDLFVLGHLPWGRFLFFNRLSNFSQRFFNIRNPVEI